MPGDLRQGHAAVFRQFKQPSGLSAHQNGHHIDQCHQQAREEAGREHVLRDGVIIGHAHAADHVNHHDAEGQTGDGVHGAVALDQRGEKCIALIGRHRLHGRRGGTGGQQRRDHQHGKEDQENRIDDLADPDGDLAGAQGEKQHEGKKHGGEDQQIQPFRPAVPQHGRDAGGKGHRGASGNGEQRPDGQIQQTGEEDAVSLAHLAGEGL